MNDRLRKYVVVSAMIIVSMALMLAGGLGSPNAGAESAFAVYLQPATVPTDERLNISDSAELLAEREFVIVSDARTFIDEVNSRNPQSIWIHADAVESVPDELLQQLLSEGRVVVGIDMPSILLTSKLDVEQSSSPDWNPVEVTTFVIVGQARDVAYTNDFGEQATRGSFTFVNDYFDPAAPDRLIFLVNDVVASVRETYDGAQ